MCQNDHENGLPECQLSFARGVPENDVLPLPYLVLICPSGDEKVVQAEFEIAVNKFGESDAFEHSAERPEWNPVLMLVAFHFAADKASCAKDSKHWIDQG